MKISLIIENLIKILEIGPTIDLKEILIIEEMLKIKELNNEQLIKIRNAVVKFTSDVKLEARTNGDWEMFDTYHNAMSKITCVIDTKLHN